MFFTAIAQERLFKAGQMQLDQLSALGRSLLAGAERLKDLNLQAARACISHGLDINQSASSLDDLKAAHALAGEIGRPLYVAGLAYGRGLHEIAIDSRNELAGLVAVQLSQLQREISVSLDQVADAAPDGSESAIAAVKTALATLNEAYERMSAAGKEAVEIVDARVNAVADSLEESAASEAEADAGNGKSAAKPRARKAIKEVTV